MENVISKVGEVSFDDFGKLMGLFGNDIIEDFTKDFDSELDKLDKKEIKQITKSLNYKAVRILRERLKR